MSGPCAVASLALLLATPAAADPAGARDWRDHVVTWAPGQQHVPTSGAVLHQRVAIEDGTLVVERESSKKAFYDSRTNTTAVRPGKEVYVVPLARLRDVRVQKQWGSPQRVVHVSARGSVVREWSCEADVPRCGGDRKGVTNTGELLSLYFADPDVAEAARAAIAALVQPGG